LFLLQLQVTAVGSVKGGLHRGENKHTQI